MFKTNWKSTALLSVVSLTSLGLLLVALVGTLSLPLFGVAGLLSWFALVALTLPASQLTVIEPRRGSRVWHEIASEGGEQFLLAA